MVLLTAVRSLNGSDNSPNCQSHSAASLLRAKSCAMGDFIQTYRPRSFLRILSLYSKIKKKSRPYHKYIQKFSEQESNSRFFQLNQPPNDLIIKKHRQKNPHADSENILNNQDSARIGIVQIPRHQRFHHII